MFGSNIWNLIRCADILEFRSHHIVIWQTALLYFIVPIKLHKSFKWTEGVAERYL
jgi:hypothetical protein